MVVILSFGVGGVAGQPDPWFPGCSRAGRSWNVWWVQCKSFVAWLGGGASFRSHLLSAQILLPFKLYTIDWFWNMRCSLCTWLRRNLGRGLLCTQIYCKSRIQQNRFCSITTSCRRWRGLSPCFLFTCSNRQQTLGSWRITFLFCFLFLALALFIDHSFSSDFTWFSFVCVESILEVDSVVRT